MTEHIFSAVDYRECKADYIAFRNANRETDRNEAYFEWRFLKKPGGSSPLVIWAESASGEKIGSLGFTQDVYMADGIPCVFGQLSDISIAGRWRGQGIAKKMLIFLSNLNEFKTKKASFAMPNKDASKALEKAGWITLSNIDRYVKILKTDSKIIKILGKNSLSTAVTKPLNLALKFSSYEAFHREQKPYSAAPVKKFDERFDTFWLKYEKKGAVLGLRTSEYLTWRYSMHPLVDYKIFALFESERIMGYVVYFFDTNQCHVEDILAMQGGNYPRLLLSYFIKFIRENPDAEAVIVRVNENTVCPLPLKQFGFFRRPDAQKFMIRMGTAELLTDPQRWFLTSGDKDA